MEANVEMPAANEGPSFLERKISMTRLGYALVAVMLMAGAAYPVLNRWAGQPNELELLPPVALSEPGQMELSFHRGDGVTVPAEAPVIGLAINGKARTYLVWGMSQPKWHLAHDNFGGQPVTVTYCDWQDCARALDRGEVPAAAIRLAGFAEGQMQLAIGQGQHGQADDNLPLAEVPMERTTWGQWREAHPESEIYLGQRTDLAAEPME